MSHDAIVKAITDGDNVSHSELAVAVGTLAQPVVTTDDPDHVDDLRMMTLILSGASVRHMVAELVRQGVDPRAIVKAGIEHWQLSDPNPPVAQPAPAPAAQANPASVFASAAANASQAQPAPTQVAPPPSTPTTPVTAPQAQSQPAQNAGPTRRPRRN